MPSTLEHADLVDQPQLSRYINDLQRRYPSYTRSRVDDIKHDAFSRLFSEYMFMGSRTNFEDRLQNILTNAERQQLSADPTFTRAWQIFVDICWLKRKFTRLAILLGVIVGVLAIVFLVFLAAPLVIGPKAR